MADKILRLKDENNTEVGALELLNRAPFVAYYSDIGSLTLNHDDYKNACVPKTYNSATRTNEYQTDPKTNDALMGSKSLYFTKDDTNFYRPVSHRKGLVIDTTDGGNGIKYRFLGVSAGVRVFLRGKSKNSTEISGNFGGGDWYPVNNRGLGVNGEAGCSFVSNGDQEWHTAWISQCFNHEEQGSGEVKTTGYSSINDFNVFLNPSAETAHCSVEYHSGQYFLFNREEDHGHNESHRSWISDFLGGFFKTVVRWVAIISLVPVYDQRTQHYMSGPYIDQNGYHEYGAWHRCICAMTYWNTDWLPSVKYAGSWDDTRVNTADAKVESNCLNITGDGSGIGDYTRGTYKFFNLG